MIKLVIFGVLGLVVGMGGGSAMSVMKAKKAFATHEAQRAKIVADSLAEAESHVAATVTADDSAGTDSSAHTTDSTATPPAEHPTTDVAHAKTPPRPTPVKATPMHKPEPAAVESHGAAPASGKPVIPQPVVRPSIPIPPSVSQQKMS
jgi:hypothetical protein